LGIPLVRIHLRNYRYNFFPVISIIVFILALLIITFMFASENINTYWGSLAMVVVFIMALAYPKKKYDEGWD